MEYTEHPAPPDLRRYVQCLWELRDDAPDDAIRVVYPDGRCELLAELGVPLRFHGPGGEIRADQALCFAGQHLGPIRLQATGPVHCVGVRLAPAGIATAGPKQSETFDVWLRAGVAIDGAGHVQDLQWEEQSKVHALIAERLAPVVRSWEFEPATVDGQPAPTQTGLLIHILADELADGSVAMRLADAKTGPIALSLAVPTYPADAVRSGVEATVIVTVEVNADGSPIIRETAYEKDGSSRSEYYRKAFVASATEAVKHWKFQPELVAGRVVPGSDVRIPIDYCLEVSSSSCDRKQKPAVADRKLPPGLYLGDASAVALKTDIREQVI